MENYRNLIAALVVILSICVLYWWNTSEKRNANKTFYSEKRNQTSVEGILFDEPAFTGVIESDTSDQLTRGVEFSIKERRPDQAYFIKVAQSQGNQSSKFGQTVTQAKLL